MHPTRILTLLLFTVAIFLLPAAGDPPPPAPTETETELAAAFSLRLQQDGGNQSLTLELFYPELDAAFTSPDGKSAVLWLRLRDDNGRLLRTEPGMALARQTEQGWQVLLPGDPGWEETFAALPDGMLPQELSPAPAGAALSANAVSATYSGYYLPYAAGTARWLEGSISHFQSIPELGYPSCSQEYCRYAYDFTDEWHYPLLAAKEGSVVAWRDSCPDGSTSCTNYIVLHNSNEDTYQIYLHLAYNTIPNKLTPGAAVARGQYLGDTDDTGYSTSQHVHFMVTESIWMGNGGYYWGQSVDIRFADVTINNGIPRTCYEVTAFPIYDGATECLGNKSDPRNPANDWFVSGNVGAYPPTGTLSTPAAGATVVSGVNTLMDVTATAKDDVKVTAVRLVAKLNGAWAEVGPKVTQAAQPDLFDWDVDLCQIGPLNGPLEVALRIWDHEGNMTPALDSRTIQVDHACPPPTSQLKPAETFNSTAVRLSWDAAPAGAGLASFELQWRTVPGNWEAANTLFLPGSARSTWFGGQAGATYAFRLRALDANGQPEPWPLGGGYETSAALPAACTPDALEPDDDYTQASMLALGGNAQANLCPSGNADWFRVEIAQAGSYLVSAASQSGGAAVKITVYTDGLASILASSEAPGIGQASSLRFQTAAGGAYYIRIDPLTPALMGTGAVYGLNVREVKEIFLPIVSR